MLIAEDLLDAIYQAAVDPDAFDALATRLGRAGGYESALVMLRQGLNLVDASMMIEPSYIEQYLAYYGRIDPYGAAVLRQPLDVVSVGQEIIGDAEFLETEFYRDFARYQGIFRPMGVTMAVGEDLRLSFGVNRPRAQAEFDEDDRNWIRVLAPHVRRAVQLRRNLRPLRTEADTRQGMLDGLAFGVILADPDGTVRVVNGHAEAIVRRERGLLIRAGKVGAAQRLDGDRLAALLRDVGEGGAGGALRMGDMIGAPSLACLVSPVPAMLDGDGRRLAMISVRTLGLEAEPSPAVLAQLFGLSPAEASVTVALVRGLTVEAIAAERVIALPTLRTQLRSIFRKTGTANQRDLMRLVGSLPQVRLGRR